MVATPAHAAVITIQNPSPTQLAFFGQSIDSANGFLVVGENNLNGGSGEAFLYDADNGSLITTLASPDSQAGGEFGWSVEISGSLLFVGAPGETVNGVDNAGRVYIFDLGTGTLSKTLVSTSPEHLGDFGRAVDVADRLLAVGAPFETVNSVPAGRVHIFDMTTSTEIMNLATPNPGPGHSGAFGATINIADDHIIVGAPGENAFGRAYVFDIRTGSLLSTLHSPSVSGGGLFGSSVAIMNDRAFVGSPFEFVNPYVSVGRVYEFNIFTGAPVRTISDPIPIPWSAGFGRSIALADNNVIVGSPYDNATASTFGHVYVFNAESGRLKTTLVNPERGGCFGNSVDVSRVAIYVGNPCQTVNEQYSAGAIYIFSEVIGHGRSGSDQN